jgi:outer membrane protein insertion porin family
METAWLLALALALAVQVPPPESPAAAPFPAVATPTAAAGAAAPTVVAVELRSDAPLKDLEQLRTLLAIRPGEPLDEARVRRTLTNLYASGAASEIEVLSRPAAGGVVAVVALWTTVVAEKVAIAGTELGLKREELAAALPQAEAQPLLEDRVVRGVYRLEDLYHQRGFLEAEVRVAVGYLDAAGKRAVVTYQVASGPRATVAEVDFDGSPAPFAPAELAAALKMAPGSPFRQRTMEESVGRLHRWLIDHGYRAARVDEPQQQYDKTTHRMHLTYPLDIGPKVTVEVVGADLATLRKKDLLPFLGPEGYDEALLLQSVDRVERYYQERGHYRVSVKSHEEQAPGELRLTLTVEPGPQYTLDKVVFSGNERVSDAKLAELMTTSPRRLLALGSGRLVDEVLAADLDNIRSYYALQGFSGARVPPPEVSEQGDRLTVTITVEEGRRQRVAELEFEGVESLAPAELRKALTAQGLLTAGGPFHPVLLEDTLEVIRGRYEAAGFASAQVSAATTWNDDATRVGITIQVLEGPRTLVDRIIIRGNRKTHDRVIRRTLELASGEPVSGARLLEAQRRLYRLGAFSRADVALAPAPPGAASRDVVVRVEEGDTRRLTYGFGYDSEDGVRGLAGYSDSNLAGRGFTLGADLRLALDVAQSLRNPPLRDGRSQVSLTQPFIGRFDVPLTYTLFYTKEEQQSFNVERRGGRLEASRAFGTRNRLGLIYDYRLVRSETLATPTAGVPADQPSREDRDIRISSVIPNVLFDRRDDPLDPTRGWTSYTQVQYAFPFLVTTEEFLKVFLQETGYYPAGHAGVVAGSLRLGGIEPLRAGGDDPVVPAELPSSRVSIAERFFAGGSNTHRAYRLDQLGIPGRTTFGGEPVGGNGLLLVNLDYRFPVVGQVGGVVFFDAGNVWADWRDVDPREAKLGLGLGVRYLSPIGPLRLEVGWKLDREPGEPGYAVFLSVGNPF